MNRRFPVGTDSCALLLLMPGGVVDNKWKDERKDGSGKMRVESNTWIVLWIKTSYSDDIPEPLTLPSEMRVWYDYW